MEYVESDSDELTVADFAAKHDIVLDSMIDGNPFKEWPDGRNHYVVSLGYRLRSGRSEKKWVAKFTTPGPRCTEPHTAEVLEHFGALAKRCGELDLPTALELVFLGQQFCEWAEYGGLSPHELGSVERYRDARNNALDLRGFLGRDEYDELLGLIDLD